MVQIDRNSWSVNNVVEGQFTDEWALKTVASGFSSLLVLFLKKLTIFRSKLKGEPICPAAPRTATLAITGIGGQGKAQKMTRL